MSTYFVDTSALIKRYIHEAGSVWVRSWVTPVWGHIVVVSQIARVELSSVFARKQRGHFITPNVATVLHNTAHAHMSSEYLVIQTDDSLLREATRLVCRYYLRSLDGIQLAAAVQARQVLGRPIVFVAADRRLLSAAAAEGFATDDPTNHA